MENITVNLMRAMILAAILMVGCGDSEDSGPVVDSELPGVYRIDVYEGSQDGCEQPTDISGAPGYLVLYSFRPNDALDEARLGGTFCSSVEDCRAVAQAALEPTIGYSFWEGTDDTEWRGWAIASAGAANDQCRADVQAHVLTSLDTQSIDIETKTFETVFPPTMAEGNEATCRNADALAALEPDLPCKAILLLEGTREAGL